MQVDRLSTSGFQGIDVQSLCNNWRHKIEFSDISGTDKVKQNEKKIKTIENLLNL